MKGRSIICEDAMHEWLRERPDVERARRRAVYEDNVDRLDLPESARELQLSSAARRDDERIAVIVAEH